MFGDKHWDMFYGQHIYMTSVHIVYKFSANKQEELKEDTCSESLDMIKIIFHICETWSVSMNHEFLQVEANYLHHFV